MNIKPLHSINCLSLVVLLPIVAFAQSNSAGGTDQVAPAGKVGDNRRPSAECPWLVKHVTGTALLPSGKPAAGTLYTGTEIGSQREESIIVAQGQTNGNGRFELAIGQLPKGAVNAVFLLAAAEGYGLGWTRANFDDWPPDYEIRLVQETILHGKLFNADGQPAADVGVRIHSLLKKHPIDSVIFDDKFDWNDAFTTKFITDTQGQITVRRLPPDVGVSFGGPEEKQLLPDWSWRSDAENPVHTLTVPDSFSVSGTITAADTGQPIADATLTARDAKTTTDAAGKFRLKSAVSVGSRQTVSITARPPIGSPYLPQSISNTRPPVGAEAKLEIKLRRGVLVSGELVEEGSGKPVAGVRISSYTRGRGASFETIGAPVAITDLDGKFAFVASPGTIDICVDSASCDFVMQPLQIEHRLSPTQGFFTEENVFAHLTTEVPAGAQGDVRLVIQRGITIRGEIVGTGGKTPTQVSMRRPYPQQSGFTDNYRLNMVSTHGHFAIHGVPPDGEMPVVFLDAANDEGKYETIRGSDAGEWKKITLEECGSASVRFVDSDGKPIAARQQTVVIAFSDQTRPQVGVAADEKVLPFSLANWEIDFEKYVNQATDDEGRLLLTHLVPGLTYMVRTGNLKPDGLSDNLLIRVAPGQHIDAPDIVVQRPPAAKKAAAPAAKAKPAEKVAPN